MLSNKDKPRKLKLRSGDINLKHNKMLFHDHPKRNSQAYSIDTDPFISYKQSYQLPIFKTKQKYKTVDVKKRLKSLQSRSIGYKINSKIRSKTIVGDTIGDKYIKRELCSIDLGQINDGAVRNQLDQKYLTEYEKDEIHSYKHVYYIGYKAHIRKVRNIEGMQYKNNFRDHNNNYKVLIGDHIAYRFQIVCIIGSGAFGKVLEVIDHKTNKKYALKILKSCQDLYQQFHFQIKVMKMAKQHSSASKNIIEIKGDFEFRGHVVQHLAKCLVYYNRIVKYQFIRLHQEAKFCWVITECDPQNSNSSFTSITISPSCIRNIIHCDIKPENVVFKEFGKSGVKLIDLGSSCFYHNKQFTYIQSRYYRSPEIILMKPYDHKIDIWSLGCMAYEMYTGAPLFPSRSQNEQILMLKSTLGLPNAQFLSQCKRNSQFSFHNSNQIEQTPLFSLKSRLKGSASKSFIDFIESTVRWSPQQRLSVIDALNHEFILEGLPNNVKMQHLAQMNGNNPYNLY